NFRVWNPLQKGVFIKRDIVFDLSSELSHTVTLAPLESDSSCSEKEQSSSSEELEEAVSESTPLVISPAPVITNKKPGRPKGSKNKIYERVERPLRSNTRLCVATADPSDYNEALQSENSEEWIAAMNDEMASLKKNETWHLVERPIGANIVKNRWVFRTKENSDGTVARFKARLVAKGYTQMKGIDFHETFAPVVKMTSVRTILAIAAHNDMELVQFDVKTAFLHGELKEEIF
ncbi:integrase core domain protein-like protein, partial [Leptotrombidium deliense]